MLASHCNCVYPPATGRAEGKAGELEALTQTYMVPFAGYSRSKGGCKRLRVIVGRRTHRTQLRCCALRGSPCETQSSTLGRALSGAPGRRLNSVPSHLTILEYFEGHILARPISQPQWSRMAVTTPACPTGLVAWAILQLQSKLGTCDSKAL